MKKIALGLWLLAAIASAQVNSDQIKKKTDGGIQGDSAKALTVAPKVSSTAPTSPITGQLWIDTTTATPACKYWNGSAWTACSTYSTMTTQADISSFPGSPSDGQFFWDKSHNTIWVYNSTSSNWCNPFTGSCTGSAVSDTFTGTPITPPVSAPTLTDGGAGGNMTSGTHVCAIMYSNSTGGETTAGSSATASVSITASHKITLTSIPTGGTGTTQRRVYCSKAGTTTPRFWVDTVADNSTTSLTSNGIADASMIVREPDTNYSAALPSGWGMTNTTAQTTSGGCGATGSAMICRGSHSGTSGTAGTEVGVIGYRDITTWASGNFVIEYRLTRLEGGFAIGSGNGVGHAGGLTVGTSFSAGPLMFSALPISGTLGPLSTTQILSLAHRNRTTIGAASSVLNAIGGYAFPRATALPIYLRIVKKGHFYEIFYASDSNKNWVPVDGTTGPSSINPADSTIANGPSSDFDTFILNASATSNTTGLDEVLAIDSFTLTPY